MIKLGFIVIFILLGAAWAQDSKAEEAKEFIDALYTRSGQLAQDSVQKKWAYITADKNTKREKKMAVDAARKAFNDFTMESYERFKQFDWKSFSDPDLKRKFFLWSDFGEDLLPESEKEKFEKLETDMHSIQPLVKGFNAPNDSPLLKNSDVISRIKYDYANLAEVNYYWREWHNAAGIPLKELFKQWVDLENLIAEKNGFPSLVEYWGSIYEVDNYEATMGSLFEEIKPLYQELHAYIRFKLWEENGKKMNVIDPSKPIPASLLGWNWGLDASPLIDRFLPYNEKPSLNITPALQEKNLKGRELVEKVEEFFQSLGFKKLPKEFYEHSYFQKGLNMDCSQDTFDFYNDLDYRVKMCAEASHSSFNSAINNICFAEWAEAYMNKPHFYKRPPTVPFGSALMGAMVKLVNSPHYLKSIELIDQRVELDNKLQINILFKEAVTWLFFLPFGLAYDQWRWQVIKKKITPENYNCEYWNLRTKYQGVEPPVDRTNNEFDPGVHHWAINGGQYMQYYMARFIEFDIIRGLCRSSGYYEPKTKPTNNLVFCDISNSHEAGSKIQEAMKLGNSVPWYEVLKTITGQSRIDPSAVLDYFKPLQDWLQQENEENKAVRGWPDRTDRCR